MILASALRKTSVILLGGKLYSVLEHQHVKPGKGHAFVRTKLKEVQKGIVVEKTFRSEEKIQPAELLRRKFQYLYAQGDQIVFMDLENYEQHEFPKEQAQDWIFFVKEGMEVDLELYEGQILNVIPPNFVEMEVEYTEPGLKGDSATSGTKPARLETGYTLQVPLFVQKGERIQVDTRKGQYITRV